MIPEMDQSDIPARNDHGIVVEDEAFHVAAGRPRRGRRRQDAVGWRSRRGRGITLLRAAALSQTALKDLRLRFTTIGGRDSNVRAAYATAVVTTSPS